MPSTQKRLLLFSRVLWGQHGCFQATSVDMDSDAAAITHTGLSFCRPAGRTDSPPVIPHAFASDVDAAQVVAAVVHDARLIRTCIASGAGPDPGSNSCYHAGLAEGVPVVVPIRRL